MTRRPPPAPFVTGAAALRRPERHEIPVEVRTALFDRAASACELCEVRLQHGWEAHHRVRRSQGGRDVLSNLVALCRRDHTRVHHHVGWSLTTGFLLRSTDDPSKAPVALYQRGWVLLDDDGGRWPLPDDEQTAVTP